MYKKAIRTLNIPGGGCRGELSYWLIYDIINLLNIPFAQFISIFDILTGTSIGGVLSLAFAYGLDLSDISPFFDKGKRIFSTSVADNDRAGITTKLASFITSSPWYESPSIYDALPDGQKYGHKVLYKMLDDIFGNDTLSALKKTVVIPAFRSTNQQYVMFSNYKDDRYFVNNNEKIADVAKATSAAPLYLPEYKIGNYTYWDGGIGVNNPIEMGGILGSVLFPNAQSIFLLNISTGTGFLSFSNQDIASLSGSPFSVLSNILGVVMSGAELYCDYKLDILTNRAASSFFTQNNYFKSYKTKPVFVSELDDCANATRASFRQVAADYVTKESANIVSFFNALTS
jgi:hypothetical protein